MSFGYLIATQGPAPCLENSRRYKFQLLSLTADFVYYFRFEEGTGLTERKGRGSTLTSDGITLLAAIDRPFFLKDCLLAKNEGAADAARSMRTAIIRDVGIESMTLLPNRIMRINQIYRVHS